jgi:5,10-methylene-tetrahydrofolate dehydrogenase/methenyl tetrahydrofolate cyclohydrolase
LHINGAKNIRPANPAGFFMRINNNPHHFLLFLRKTQAMDFSAKMLRDDALKGKVIVVTGGGSGLGKAMTKYFLELGANVAITSRDLDKLKNTASELEAQTGGTRGEAERSGAK